MAKKSGRTSGTKKFALASKAEFCSGSFQDLMLTLNCFAERWGLRRLSSTLEGWEYPWFLFNAFDGADWSQVRLLDMDSDLNPMPWFMASLGAQVELVGKRGMRTAQWEDVRRRTGLKVDWQVPSVNQVRIPEQCYDVVTCFSAAEPCPGQDIMVAEAAKALRSGGTFLISSRLRPPSRGLSLPWRSSGVLTIKKFTQTIWEHPAFGANAENPGWGLRPDDILVEKDRKCRFPGPVTAGAAVLRKNTRAKRGSHKRDAGMILSSWTYRRFILWKTHGGSSGSDMWVRPWVSCGTPFILFSNPALHACILSSDTSKSPIYLQVGFAIYLCSGLIPWMRSSETVTRCTSSFIANANYLKKSLLYPRAGVRYSERIELFHEPCHQCCSFHCSVYILGPPSSPVLAGFATGPFAVAGFGFGLGLFLGVMNAFFRDIRH